MSDYDFKPYLKALAAGNDVSVEETRQVFEALMDGRATQGQIGALLMGLARRGIQEQDLSCAAEAMRARMVPVTAPAGAIDTCGTGGDAKGTLNISTAAALVIAACGVPVAKHGNRALTSRSGSSQVLEALGVRMDLTPAQAAEAINKVGMGFLMAPNHHPAMAHVGPVRRELGIRTVFNVLGPLLNPAGVKRQVIGVFDQALLQPVAKVAGALGAERVWVVHGADGMDELTVTGDSHVVIYDHGGVQEMTVHPEDYGLPVRPLSALIGGEPEENAQALKALLEGAAGAYRDIVLLNAGAGLVVAGRAGDLKNGIAAAADALDRGAALGVLEKLVAFGKEVGHG